MRVNTFRHEDDTAETTAIVTPVQTASVGLAAGLSGVVRVAEGADGMVDEWGIPLVPLFPLVSNSRTTRSMKPLGLHTRCRFIETSIHAFAQKDTRKDAFENRGGKLRRRIEVIGH